MSTQPIALWLADKLEDIPSFDGHWLTINNAANELRRLHEESERLKAAAQRQWVGLTEEEHTQIAVDAGCMSSDWVFYGAAVERALKEKNK